jgi:hypothetical protein
MTNIHNAYIDNGHVTVRQFANNNDLNVQSLRNLVRHDNNINSSFIKNGTRHYELPVMNEWLIANIHKFADDRVRPKKPSILEEGIFFCGNCGEYKPTAKKASTMHCDECSDKRTKPVFISTKDVKVVAIDTSSRRGIAAIMEKRALDDVISDNWMEL